MFGVFSQNNNSLMSQFLIKLKDLKSLVSLVEWSFQKKRREERNNIGGNHSNPNNKSSQKTFLCQNCNNINPTCNLSLPIFTSKLAKSILSQIFDKLILFDIEPGKQKH